MVRRVLQGSSAAAEDLGEQEPKLPSVTLHINSSLSPTMKQEKKQAAQTFPRKDRRKSFPERTLQGNSFPWSTLQLHRFHMLLKVNHFHPEYGWGVSARCRSKRPLPQPSRPNQ